MINNLSYLIIVGYIVGMIGVIHSIAIDHIGLTFLSVGMIVFAMIVMAISAIVEWSDM